MNRKMKPSMRKAEVELAFAPEWAKVHGIHDASTRLALQLHACRNPVPAAAMALDMLSERIPIGIDDYWAILEDVAIRTVWAEDDCDRYVEVLGPLPRFQFVDRAHCIFCTALLERMRHMGSDIPVQKWEEIEEVTRRRTALDAGKTQTRGE